MGQLAGPWWLLLVTGIVWLVIALIVLRFRLASVVAVGALMGVVFLGGWFSELLIASMRARARAGRSVGVLFGEVGDADVCHAQPMGEMAYAPRAQESDERRAVCQPPAIRSGSDSLQAPPLISRPGEESPTCLAAQQRHRRSAHGPQR